ncbi:MAG: hypothetical protein IJF71_03915, partial [Clostridia bacterium]|nr:hypothetical protein [Clostridia bacterium]
GNEQYGKQNGYNISIHRQIIGYFNGIPAVKCGNGAERKSFPAMAEGVRSVAGGLRVPFA